MLSEFHVPRRIAAASLSALCLLSACAPKHGEPVDTDRYAGLSPQILVWRTALEAQHSACALKVNGRGCEAFQVTCKAAQAITSAERARGVSAKLVAAMTFNGRSPDGSGGKLGSAFAIFTKAGGVWARTEAAPVNMTSCALI